MRDQPTLTAGETLSLMALQSTDLLGCKVCGGATVSIRGRYPGEVRRVVCPTCLADKLYDIHHMSAPEYGIAMQTTVNNEP